MKRLLHLEGVRKAYGEGRALDGVRLDLFAGEIHALVGLNGAGKTTLMRAAIGAVLPDAGEVQVFGEPAAAAPASVWARVGHMIDAPFCYRELTVRENLVASLRLHGHARTSAEKAASLWLERLRLLPWEHRPAASLSLGNRQRLGLACALAHEPELLILDEPTNALDPSGVVLVRDALSTRADDGAGILVSSHHLDEVARVAHRVSVVHAGLIVGTLDPGGADLEKRFFEMVYAHDARRAEAS